VNAPSFGRLDATISGSRFDRRKLHIRCLFARGDRVVESWCFPFKFPLSIGRYDGG
jgi:hypothetical protein